METGEEKLGNSVQKELRLSKSLIKAPSSEEQAPCSWQRSGQLHQHLPFTTGLLLKTPKYYPNMHSPCWT